MKRSEAIQKLDDFIGTNFRVGKNTTADEIITFLEGEGFLPPARKLDHKEYLALSAFGTMVRLEFYSWDKE